MPSKQFSGKLAFLSNMYRCNIMFEGDVYPSTENAYQAAKCAIESQRIHFQKCSPFDAKKKGRKILIREDWNQVKLDIMQELIESKFNDSSQGFGDKLCMVPDEDLVEYNYWHDNYWGHCTCVRCKNKKHNNFLGLLLQKKKSKLLSLKEVKCNA